MEIKSDPLKGKKYLRLVTNIKLSIKKQVYYAFTTRQREAKHGYMQINAICATGRPHGITMYANRQIHP